MLGSLPGTGVGSCKAKICLSEVMKSSLCKHFYLFCLATCTGLEGTEYDAGVKIWGGEYQPETKISPISGMYHKAKTPTQMDLFIHLIHFKS